MQNTFYKYACTNFTSSSSSFALPLSSLSLHSAFLLLSSSSSSSSLSGRVRFVFFFSQSISLSLCALRCAQRTSYTILNIFISLHFHSFVLDLLVSLSWKGISSQSFRRSCFTFIGSFARRRSLCLVNFWSFCFYFNFIATFCAASSSSSSSCSFWVFFIHCQ